MKIEQVRIRNFRSLADVTVAIDDYTALVGANGSGKSSVLYALDWFFNGRPVSADDVHNLSHQTEGEGDVASFDVTVTFGQLSDVDRKRLERYGRGSKATFRRTWRDGEKEKIVGNAMQGPGFAEIRGMAKVGEFRPAYQKLVEQLPNLPDLGDKPPRDQVVAALDEWEESTQNFHLLEEVVDSDATRMFGFNGENVLRQCVRLVLVPAAADIVSEVGNSTGKSSALNDLIGAVMSEANARATALWIDKHADAISELRQTVTNHVEAATADQAERVNRRLSALIPNAKLSLTPSMPNWSPRAVPSVRTEVEVDGISNDLSRHGHGVQRAVMMSMFQALVPDDEATLASHKSRIHEDEDVAAIQLAEELSLLPHLVVAIEEPEIYQHPIRSRTFSRTLTALSSSGKAQVVVGTHSPYFIRPEQFSSVRRFSISQGISTMRSTSVAKLSTATSVDVDNLEKFIHRQVPTDFSEGFFADAVVLVEGVTDKAIFQPLCEELGVPLDARGVCVIDVGGKNGFRIPYELFTALSIPVHILADGDYLAAGRCKDPEKGKKARESNCKQTADLARWVRGLSEEESQKIFGRTTETVDGLTLWHDDVESELESWGTFVTALSLSGGELRGKKVHLYKEAVRAAQMSDLPDGIRQVALVMASLASD